MANHSSSENSSNINISHPRGSHIFLHTQHHEHGSNNQEHGHHHHHHDHDHTHHEHSHLHHTHHLHERQLFFIIPKGVILQYGPYTFHGVCDFRIERLQGIQKCLEKMGAQIKMVPCTDFINRLQVFYMKSVIFTCKITDLNHGGDGEMDNLCIVAAKNFDQACRRSIHGLRNRIEEETDKMLKEPSPKCEDDNNEEQEEASTAEKSEDTSNKTDEDEEEEEEEYEEYPGEGEEDEIEVYKLEEDEIYIENKDIPPISANKTNKVGGVLEDIDDNQTVSRGQLLQYLDLGKKLSTHPIVQ